MSQGHGMSEEEERGAVGRSGLDERSTAGVRNADPTVQAMLSERVGEEAPTGFATRGTPSGDGASPSEIAQLRRDVAQLTETVALLLDMQQGPVSSRPSGQGRAGLLGAASAAAESARVQGHDALQRGQEAVGAIGSTLERQVTVLTREVADMAERNPLGTVLGALGLGFLVGAVLCRR